jgi:hypothetical protein
MNLQHRKLAAGQWKKMSFLEQMANIGSEVERALNWREKKNNAYGQLAFERALELLEITISDNKNKKRLKELARLKEILVDYFIFDNEYHSTVKGWKSYFYNFNYAARLGR